MFSERDVQDLYDMLRAILDTLESIEGDLSELTQQREDYQPRHRGASTRWGP